MNIIIRNKKTKQLINYRKITRVNWLDKNLLITLTKEHGEEETKRFPIKEYEIIQVKKNDL